MNTYDIVFEIAEMLYPNEKGIINALYYIGLDDAVGFIVYNEFARDYEDLKKFIGKEKAQIIIDHYELHCK